MKIFEVGGCVRDELLGLESKDIDFTVVLDDTSLSVDEGWNKMLKWLRSEGFDLFLETKDCLIMLQNNGDHSLSSKDDLKRIGSALMEIIYGSN